MLLKNMVALYGVDVRALLFIAALSLDFVLKVLVLNVGQFGQHLHSETFEEIVLASLDEMIDYMEHCCTRLGEILASRRRLATSEEGSQRRWTDVGDHEEEAFRNDPTSQTPQGGSSPHIPQEYPTAPVPLGISYPGTPQGDTTGAAAQRTPTSETACDSQPTRLVQEESIALTIYDDPSSETAQEDLTTPEMQEDRSLEAAPADGSPIRRLDDAAQAVLSEERSRTYTATAATGSPTHNSTCSYATTPVSPRSWLDRSQRTEEEVEEMLRWFDGWQHRRRRLFRSQPAS